MGIIIRIKIKIINIINKIMKGNNHNNNDK